jgi:hypothetical protein
MSLIFGTVPLLFLVLPCTTPAFFFLALEEFSTDVSSDALPVAVARGAGIFFLEKVSSAWTSPVYSIGPAAASWGDSASFALGMAALVYKTSKFQELIQITVTKP